MKYIIGVDSGGTHIVGQAFAMSGKLLAKAESGPGNIFLDETKTLKHLQHVLSQLFNQLPRSDCQYILLGIAGIETKGIGDQVAQQFSQTYQISTYVISDAQLALLNGLEGHDGTLAIAGTGSVVYGRQNKKLLRYGGWGNLLGDTGSAYKIAENAVNHMLHCHDTGRTSSLQAKILAALQSNSLTTAVQYYYQADRKTIAKLALIVAQAQNAGDVEASQLLRDQAQALAGEIAGLLQRYQEPRPMQLALSGSVLVHNDFYRQVLVNKLKESYPQLEALVVTTNNSRGALFWPRWQSR